MSDNELAIKRLTAPFPEHKVAGKEWSSPTSARGEQRRKHYAKVLSCHA